MENTGWVWIRNSLRARAWVAVKVNVSSSYMLQEQENLLWLLLLCHKPAPVGLDPTWWWAGDWVGWVREWVVWVRDWVRASSDFFPNSKSIFPFLVNIRFFLFLCVPFFNLFVIQKFKETCEELLSSESSLMPVLKEWGRPSKSWDTWMMFNFLGCHKLSPQEILTSKSVLTWNQKQKLSIIRTKNIDKLFGETKTLKLLKSVIGIGPVFGSYEGIPCGMGTWSGRK